MGAGRLKPFFNAYVLVMLNISGAKIANLLDFFMKDYPDPLPRRVVFFGGLVNLLRGESTNDVKIEYAKVQHAFETYYPKSELILATLLLPPALCVLPGNQPRIDDPDIYDEGNYL